MGDQACPGGKGQTGDLHPETAGRKNCALPRSSGRKDGRTRDSLSAGTPCIPPADTFHEDEKSRTGSFPVESPALKNESAVKQMTRAECINTLAAFCGVRDLPELTPEALREKYQIPRADVMVLFGGSILCGGDLLAQGMRNGIAGKYIIVGGYGHTTPDLLEKIHRFCPDIDTRNMQEAEAFQSYLEHRYGLRADALETESTNCGNNITNLLDLMDSRGISCQSIILVQDATMQRRMEAGMRKYRPEIRTVSFAAYQARVTEEGGQLRYAFPIPGMWDMERYVSLLLGEIPRLTDNEEGYGPRGRGYIAHMDVPESVRAAYLALSADYPVRGADPRFASGK